MTRTRTNSRSRAVELRWVLISALVPVVLAACSGAPATREDYQRLYEDRCGFSMDRPVYCDR